MRSGQLIATNDSVIDDLLEDPDYKVYEEGTIYTLIQRTGKRSVSNNWRPLFIMTNGNGYRATHYKGKYLQLHRIMYRKFVGPLQSDMVINHKDGNPLNNSPGNLELVTQSSNNTHSYRALNKKVVKRNDVLNFYIAENIRNLKKTGLTHKQLGEMFGISKGHVSQIINYKIWTSP